MQEFGKKFLSLLVFGLLAFFDVGGTCKKFLGRNFFGRKGEKLIEKKMELGHPGSGIGLSYLVWAQR